MFCTNCGKTISDKSVFCKYCGNVIDTYTSYTPVYKAEKKSHTGLIISLVFIFLFLVGGLFWVITNKDNRNNETEEERIRFKDLKYGSEYSLKQINRAIKNETNYRVLAVKVDDDTFRIVTNGQDNWGYDTYEAQVYFSEKIYGVKPDDELVVFSDTWFIVDISAGYVSKVAPLIYHDYVYSCADNEFIKKLIISGENKDEFVNDYGINMADEIDGSVWSESNYVHLGKNWYVYKVKSENEYNLTYYEGTKSKEYELKTANAFMNAGEIKYFDGSHGEFGHTTKEGYYYLGKAEDVYKEFDYVENVPRKNKMLIFNYSNMIVIKQ